MKRGDWVMLLKDQNPVRSGFWLRVGHQGEVSRIHDSHGSDGLVALVRFQGVHDKLPVNSGRNVLVKNLRVIDAVERLSLIKG